MSQITLYLDDATEQLLRFSAQQSGMSNSKWVAELIKKQAGQEWPHELRELAGRFCDFPLRDAQIQQSTDSERILF